eukprot:6636122-Pyramimonas_sp.AAC.2
MAPVKPVKRVKRCAETFSDDDDVAIDAERAESNAPSASSDINDGLLLAVAAPADAEKYLVSANCAQVLVRSLVIMPSCSSEERTAEDTRTGGSLGGH